MSYRDGASAAARGAARGADDPAQRSRAGDGLRAANRDWPRLLPWGLALVGVLCYVNTLPNPFVFDTLRYVARHQLTIEGAQDLLRLATQDRRPLVHLSLALNRVIGDFDPAGYHLFNLFVHVLAGMALYGLIRRTITFWADPSRGSVPPRPLPQGAVGSGRWPPRDLRTAAPWLAAAVAVIWLVHPLNTQAVSYVIQRGESMMGLFLLVSLYCLVRRAEAQAERDRPAPAALPQVPLRPGELPPPTPRPATPWPVPWGLLAVLAYFASVSSKEVGAMVPLVALLLDRTFLAGSFSAALRRRWPIYAAMGATWLLVLVMILSTAFEPDASAGFGIKAISPLGYLLSQGEVILHYLRLSVWPHPLVLDYCWTSSWLHGGWVVPCLIVAALLGVTSVGVVLNRWWGFLGAWFFLVLAPTSSIMPIADLAVEHRMYVPLIAVIMLAVAGGYALLRRLPSPRHQAMAAAVVVAMVATPLATATVMRNFDYRDPIVLWQTVVEAAPHNPRAYHNLGLALQEAGEVEAAHRMYLRTLELDPNNAEAMNNLGLLYLDHGQPEAALPHLEEAIEHSPHEPEFNYNLGLAHLMLGNLEEAERRLGRAIELRPRYASAHANLALVRVRQGRLDEAERLLKRALALDPTLREAHQSMGTLMLRTGRAERAIRAYERAIALGLRTASLYTSLASAYAQTRDFSSAHFALSQAMELDPDYPPIYALLGQVLEDTYHAAGAREAYERALAMNPNQPQVAARLAMLLTTHPDDEFRDGGRAWTLLQPYVDAAGSNPLLLEALAATHAELGRFDQAVKAQQQALSLARQLNAPDEIVTPMQQRLEQYQAGQPWRDPRWEEAELMMEPPYF